MRNPPNIKNCHSSNPNRPALGLPVIKSTKRSPTQGYKAGIIEMMNSLSISPCAAPKRHVEKTTIFGKYPSFVGAELLEH